MNNYNQHWVLLNDGITWRNEYHDLHAYVKWDGCTHLWFRDQVIEHPLGCYHHICDIDDFLVCIQSLREKVTQTFDQERMAMSEEKRLDGILPFHLVEKKDEVLP